MSSSSGLATDDCRERTLASAEHTSPYRATYKRLKWVDALRALAMVFVIFGHQVPEMTGYFVITSPVKIPLFFMVTGYVFNQSRTDYRSFCRKLLRSLVVPWLSLTLPVGIIKFFVSKGAYDLTGYVMSLISGKIMWYMPCCIIAEIIWFSIHKNAKSKGRQSLYIVMPSIIISLFGLLFSGIDILNFAMISNAMVAQLFILMGWVFRAYQDEFARLEGVHLLAAAGLYGLLCAISILMWPGQVLDVHMGEYYNYPCCLLLIILGCFILFTVASRIGEYPSFLVYIGQNTLVYYLLHGFNVSLGLKLLSLIGANYSSSLIMAVLRTVWALITCGIEAAVINRFFPVIVGKRISRV